MLAFEVNHHELWRIVDSPWKRASSETAADYHFRSSHCVDPFGIFREKSLLRCVDRSKYGQPNLTSMGMSAEHEVESFEMREKLRSV